jgi:hypothetical protein
MDDCWIEKNHTGWVLTKDGSAVGCRDSFEDMCDYYYEYKLARQIEELTEQLRDLKLRNIQSAKARRKNENRK